MEAPHSERLLESSSCSRSRNDLCDQCCESHSGDCRSGQTRRYACACPYRAGRKSNTEYKRCLNRHEAYQICNERCGFSTINRFAIGISVEESGDREDCHPPARRDRPAESEQAARKKNRNGNDKFCGRYIYRCNMRGDAAGHCNQEKKWIHKAKPADANRNPESDQKCQVIWSDDGVADTG